MSAEIPGSGGNLNSAYAGYGEADPTASDFGYDVGRFPVGPLPTGGQVQEFRITDSDAFTGLRGVARAKDPFAPMQGADNGGDLAKMYGEQLSDIAGVTSMLPGQFSYQNHKNGLGNQILQEFEAGASTYNTLPGAKSLFAGDLLDTGSSGWNRAAAMSAGLDGQVQQGLEADSIEALFQQSGSATVQQDLPLTPFHRTYPNFGNGKVDYGFQEPGADKLSEDIVRAYAAVLPEGQLAGTKKELMPVFSGINQAAVEQRPIMQSLGHEKNTLWLGGVTALPEELTIDPRRALLSNENSPANLVQTIGELDSALEVMGSREADGLVTGNPYGKPVTHSDMLAGGPVRWDNTKYHLLATETTEPLLFSEPESHPEGYREPVLAHQ